ncbi:hypothetical protein BT69DRAFT_1346589 [Atractiella rhizophila]|nr:hypothetical protein BT69DRAFT_1346589 [Atractiella rhizophila]
MSFAQEVGLNSLSPKYIEILGPKYVELYNQNIVGKFLAHQVSMKENRQNPVIAGLGGEPGPAIGRIWDTKIPVKEPEGEITLRVYEPKELGEKEEKPVYINFHGGGWCIGGIGDDEPFIRHVVDRLGVIVIDVGYRLAPEFRFPVPLEDCWTAFEYIRTHASQFRINPSQIAVGGFSAGGHISAILSHRARDKGIQAIVFALIVIPVTDANALDEELFIRRDSPYKSWTEHHDGPFLSYHRMSYFYRYFLPASGITSSFLASPLLSPIHQTNFKSLPPTLVAVAEVDVLRDEGLAYARKMREEGDGWVQCWLARNVPHPFPHQYKATERAVEFRELAIKRLAEAFKGELKGKHWETNVDVEPKIAGTKAETVTQETAAAGKVGYGGN